MRTLKLLSACTLSAVLALAACSGSNGSNGSDGVNGASGIKGSTGATGATGQTGSTGSTGSTGAQGDAGAPGAPGADGSSGCGLMEIPPSVYGSSCGATCTPAGQVACEVGPNGSLIEACVNSSGLYEGVFVSSSSASTFPGNPVSDPVGAPVVLVRAALTYLCQPQNSQNDAGGEITFLAGLCRNASTHCLSSSDTYEMSVSNGSVNLCGSGGSGLWTDVGFPETTSVSADLVGTQATDFFGSSFTGFDYNGAPESCVATEAGIVCTSLATADEQKMGEECTDSTGTVRLWSCQLDAATNTVSVTCSGPAQ
jgi:hypothetical protein